MRRRQFEAYLDKVFAFSDLVAQLSDRRSHPQHPCRKVFEALFLGAVLQCPSLHQLERECRDGVLRRRIGPVSEDTFRYTLQRLALDRLFALGCEVARRLKRNGVLRTEAAGGLVVAAIDGTELCCSQVRCCEACLERTVHRRVGDETRAVTEYYHRIVAVVIVSTPFPIPVGIRFQRKGEGEDRCALALLRDLVARLGRRFLDVVVGDALYCTTPVVDALAELGLSWVFTVKDNQPELVAEVERLTNSPPTAWGEEPACRWALWHLPEVYWTAADRTVRIVKTVRTERKHRLAIRPVGTGRRAIKEPVWEQSTNVHATNMELINGSPALVERLGRSRWRIDTEVFQTLTTACALKRPSVHQNHDQALVGLTMIRVLAYTLALVYYHRQVLSHCRREQPSFRHLARRLAVAFAVGTPDTS